MTTLLMLIISIVIIPNVAANTLYPFDTKQQATQFEHLLKELRCLVCQNQDLADSNASLAQDLRYRVYRMVKHGHSDSEIIRYLTTRYGDFILFKPPIKILTALLWYGPILLLMFGLGIFWRTIRGFGKSLCDGSR